MSLTGRKVLITGAARGLGALLAERLHERGAQVALLGLEPELLEQTAARCGGAPWAECDVTDPDAVETATAGLVERLGGLDVAVANAGIGGQETLLGPTRRSWDKTIAVNLGGTYNFIRAAGPHVAKPGGYFLVTASLAAAIHLPLMTSYSASKAAVEALGNGLRMELLPTGAKVGVAYYAELATDMTTRGFDTDAARRMPIGGNGRLPVSPVGPAIDALEKAIDKRRRRVVSPSWVGAVLPIRMVAQRVVELEMRRHGLRKTIEIAKQEEAPLTTEQPS